MKSKMKNSKEDNAIMFLNILVFLQNLMGVIEVIMIAYKYWNPR